MPGPNNLFNDKLYCAKLYCTSFFFFLKISIYLVQILVATCRSLYKKTLHSFATHMTVKTPRILASLVTIFRIIQSGNHFLLQCQFVDSFLATKVVIIFTAGPAYLMQFTF